MFTTDTGNKKDQKQEILKEILRVIRRADQNFTLSETFDRAYLAFSGKEGEYTCAELYRFYVNGYKSASDSDLEESRGLKRTPQKSSFSFIKPYKSATFTSYYLGNDMPTPMFLKSISVALRLTHTEADELLKAYGYLPFYSKNIFDLSIYSVLMMNEDPFFARGSNVDPFKMIEDRYSGAIKIIEDETKRGDLDELSEITTEPVHTSQFLRDVADNAFLRDEQRFFAFVRQNAKYFSIRHGTIIREHEKYIRALGGLYGSDSDGSGSSDDNLGRYSLRSLIEKFVDYKGTHYNRDVISLAQNGDTNGFYIPTRELMILMWMYAETFIYNKDMSKTVPCTKKCEREIKRTLVASDAKELRGLYKKYFDNHAFNVREYLFPNYTSTVLVWNGESAKQRINEKLSSLGWGMLSDNNKFDLIISKLLSFSINSSGIVLYSGRHERAYPFEFRSISVPRPLQLIFGVLNEITAQAYAASSDCVKRLNLIYAAFERLDAEKQKEMRENDESLYHALSKRRFTTFNDGVEHADLDNDAIYSLIDSGSTLLTETVSTEEISALKGYATAKKTRSMTVKQLARDMMLFPLKANTYEKV